MPQKPEFKSKCCRKFKKKGKACSRCPLLDAPLPEVDKKSLRKLLEKAYKERFGKRD